MQRAYTTPAMDGSLIPPMNKDLPNVTLDTDGVKTADISGVTTFAPMIVQVRSDGDFQWATGADPVQGTGPWLEAGLHSLPVAGVAPRFVRRTIGGNTVNLYLKALGNP